MNLNSIKNFLSILVRSNLSMLYYTIWYVSAPLNIIWSWLFGIRLDAAYNYGNSVCVDVRGGSGKTTLSRKIAVRNPGRIKHVRLDECKFGENWKRYSSDEFKTRVDDSLAPSDKGQYYVVDSIYNDNVLPELTMTMLSLMRMETTLCVVWQDYNKWITMWRKGFRSFKRAIGVAEPGAAVEKWHNIKTMLWKTWTYFDGNWEELDGIWVELESEWNKTWPKFNNKE